MKHHHKHVIGFIGAGNMGGSLIGGLILKGTPATHIVIAEHDQEKRNFFKHEYGINAYSETELSHRADVIILAVKPNAVQAACKACHDSLAHSSKLIISVAAGITTEQIQRWIGDTDIPIIRAMPNTPALYGQGMSGLFANEASHSEHKEIAENLLSAVGHTLWIEKESQMNILTALSGSGPAYFFYVMECLVNAAQNLGLTEKQAMELTLQTALGSAYMATQSPESLNALRKKVTSPGGTTEQGILALKNGNIETVFYDALAAATARGEELSKLFD